MRRFEPCASSALSSFSLPTPVVNDKGRYRQHRTQVRVPKLLSRAACDCNSESIIDRFLKLLASDVPLRRSHRIVAKQKLDLFEFASWRRRAQLRRRSWGDTLFMPARLAHRLTGYQTTLAITPASCRAPFFKTRLNTFPSLTPEWRSQTSTVTFIFRLRGGRPYIPDCPPHLKAQRNEN